MLRFKFDVTNMFTAGEKQMNARNSAFPHSLVSDLTPIDAYCEYEADMRFNRLQPDGS